MGLNFDVYQCYPVFLRRTFVAVFGSGLKKTNFFT